MSDNNAPGDGNGDVKEKWQEAGFESEDAMLEAAKAANDLRRKIADAEEALKKERVAKSKTDSEYMRQSTEIGDLRKKLKELEQPADKPPNDKPAGDGDDVLETVSEQEADVLDGVLNDPKNAELKKRVALGGDKAMAEFVKAYRQEAPVDLSVSLFGSLRKKKADVVPLSSIARSVKDLFAKHNEDEKNNLAVVPPGGAPPDRISVAKKQMVTGGVSVDFFKKKP